MPICLLERNAQHRLELLSVLLLSSPFEGSITSAVAPSSSTFSSNPHFLCLHDIAHSPFHQKLIMLSIGEKLAPQITALEMH